MSNPETGNQGKREINKSLEATETALTGNVKTLQFNRSATAAEILRYMEERGLRPLTPDEVAALQPEEGTLTNGQWRPEYRFCFVREM